MQLLKSTFFKKYSSAFGNFALQPDEGWKISQSYIDYESKLLVVSTSLLDESKWERIDGGGRRIPARQYIIDPSNQEILRPDQWKTRFSYEPVEILSADGKYRLVMQRVHEPDRNDDAIESKLTEIATGREVSSGSSMAFSETKLENLLERMENRKAEEKRRKQEEDAKPSLKQVYERKLAQLQQGDTILHYHTADSAFELAWSGKSFELGIAGPLPKDYKTWSSIEYKKHRSFETLTRFWSFLLEDPKWYVSNQCFSARKAKDDNHMLLAFLIVGTANEIRRRQNFTQEEYDRLNGWENMVYSADTKREEYKQYCGNCKAPVHFFPRYPKYICHACNDGDITDTNGTKLSFSNTGFGGGFRITWWKDGVKIKEDDSQPSKVCYIRGNEFVAEEARFGGIVIQKK